jgi:hypothetical protein
MILCSVQQEARLPVPEDDVKDAEEEDDDDAAWTRLGIKALALSAAARLPGN